MAKMIKTTELQNGDVIRINYAGAGVYECTVTEISEKAICYGAHIVKAVIKNYGSNFSIEFCSEPNELIEKVA